MGACCSCQLVQLQPGKVHIKKLKDIFAAYLKNQGIKESKKNAGKNIIDSEVSENVERHAKSSAKDLVQLMQIDQQFIKKIAAVLTKRILDYEQSTELQYLGLVLLREVMSIPITDEKDKLHGPIGKGEGVQTEDRVANVRRNWQKGIKKFQHSLKFHKNLNNSPSGASAVSVAPSQAHSIFPDPQQHNPSGGKKQTQKASKKRIPGGKGTQDDKQLEYKVEELHSKQFVFCTINERLILDTISELMTYYNYEINNDQHANLMLSATAISPPQQERSPRKTVIAGQQQITEILQSKQNRQRFSETCLDILRILLENLTKSQIVENQISYFDLLTNYLFKVPQQSKSISKNLLNNLSPTKQISGANESGVPSGNLNIGAMQANAGFFQLFGLNKSHPIANGLELTVINPVDQVLGFLGEPGGDKTGEKIPIQYNFNYLHNTSFQQSEGNQDGNNHPNMKRSNKNIGRYQYQNNNNQPSGPTYSEQVTDLTFQVRLKAYSSFFQLLKIMKEGYFIKEFPQILEYVWCLLELTQNKIENLDGNKSLKNSPQKSELENICDDNEQFESLLQLGFNIFQYLCVRVSNNQDSNQIFVGVQDSPDELLQLLQNGIFQYFNKVNQWGASKFAEFVFVLMIFNGGKRRLQGKNFDFADFFVLLQAYYDKKTKALNGVEIGSLKELYMDGQRVQAVDERMFEVIFESLFRLLVVDIFEVVKESFEVTPVKVTQIVIKNKLNLIKVLFELLNLIDSAPPKASNQQDGNLGQAVPGLQNDLPTESNILYQKLIHNQTNFTQIFLDLITFIAHQSDEIKKNSQKIIIDQVSQEDLNSSMESENQLKHQSQNYIVDFQVQLQQLFELYLLKINTEHEVLIKSLDHCMCRLHAINYKLHYVRSIDDENQEQILMKEIDLLIDAVFAHMYFLQEGLNNNFTQCLIDLQILNNNGQIISSALQNNTPFTFIAQGNSTIVQNQMISGQSIQNQQQSPASKRKSLLDKGLRISELNQKLKGNQQFVGNLLLTTGQSLLSPHIASGSAAPRSSQLSQATLAQAGNFGINQLQAINFLNLNIGQNQQVGDYYTPLFQPINPDNLIFLQQICESFCQNKKNKKGQLIKKVQELCNQFITFNQLVFQIQQKLNLEISSPFLNLVTQEEESPLDPPACSLLNHNLQDLLLCFHHSHQEIYSQQFQPISQNQTASIQAKPLTAYRQKLFNEAIKQYKNQRKIKTPSNQMSSQQNFTEENLLKPMNLQDHDIPLKISDLESPNKELISKASPQHFCILKKKENNDILQQEEQNKNFKWVFSPMKSDQILQILLEASVISEDDQILQQQMNHQDLIFAENNNIEGNKILASLHSAKENPDAFQFQQLRMLTKGIFTRHNLRSQYKIFINYFANSQHENEDPIQNKFMKKIQKPLISSMILFMDNFLLTSKYNFNTFCESITSSLQNEESSKAASIVGTDYWPQKSNDGIKQSLSHEILKQLFDKFQYEKSIVYHVAFIFSLFEKVNEIQIADQANLKFNNSSFKSPPQTTLHFDNMDDQKAKKSPRKQLEQLIKAKTLLIFIFIGYLNQMCPQKQNQDLSTRFFRGYYSLIKEVKEIFAKFKLSHSSTCKSLEEFLPCLPQFPINQRNSKKSDFQDVIQLNRDDMNGSINDKNRQSEVTSQSKDQENEKFYLSAESIEITLAKFERIFNTVELHLIDSLIATDFFKAIINKLSTLQQAAQNDLALFFDFLNHSQSQNQIDSSSAQIFVGDSNESLIKRDIQQAKLNKGLQQLGNLRAPNLTLQLTFQQAKSFIINEQTFEKQNSPYFNLLYLSQPEKIQVSGINDFEGFMSKQSLNIDKPHQSKGVQKKLISSIYPKQNSNFHSPNPHYGPVIDLSKKFSNNFYGQKQDSDRITFFNKNNRRQSQKQKTNSLDDEPTKKTHLQSQNSASNFDSLHDIHDISVSLQRDYDIPIVDDPVAQISVQRSSNKKKTDRIYSFKEPEDNCSLHQIQLKSCSSLSSYDADQNQTQFE